MHAGSRDGRAEFIVALIKKAEGIHSVSGLMIHYLFFSAVSSARAPPRRTSAARQFGSYDLYRRRFIIFNIDSR